MVKTQSPPEGFRMPDSRAQCIAFIGQEVPGEKFPLPTLWWGIRGKARACRMGIVPYPQVLSPLNYNLELLFILRNIIRHGVPVDGT